jgi:excisionase family DNA binding protein
VRLLTTRELAEALGVSESSLKRWVDAGKITASRTEGGHRRIELAEAMRFIRTSGSPLVKPEILNLPEVADARANESDRLVNYLLAGDSRGARGWLMARYFEGATIAELGDGPIREAMQNLGELWRHDEAGVFVEHRGTDACLQAVAQLRSMTAAPAPDAPVALGGGPAGDPYLLAPQLAAVSLTEVGMRSINLGPDTPAAAFEAAVAQHAPELVWVSISASLAPSRSRSLSKWFASLPSSITIAIGGQQASMLGNLPARVVRVSSMVQLAELGAAIVKRTRAS